MAYPFLYGLIAEMRENAKLTPALPESTLYEVEQLYLETLQRFTAGPAVLAMLPEVLETQLYLGAVMLLEGLRQSVSPDVIDNQRRIWHPEWFPCLQQELQRQEDRCVLATTVHQMQGMLGSTFTVDRANTVTTKLCLVVPYVEAVLNRQTEEPGEECGKLLATALMGCAVPWHWRIAYARLLAFLNEENHLTWRKATVAWIRSERVRKSHNLEMVPLEMMLQGP